MKKKLLFLASLCCLSLTSTGQTWSNVGTAMNYHVYALAEYNGSLYAGGAFPYCNAFARWNGSNWSCVSVGMNNVVDDLAVDTANNILYACGIFTAAGGNIANRVAMWDGGSLDPVGNGMDSTVWTVAMYKGDLYAGGIFLKADGNTASRMAKWDGNTWSSVGTGMNNEVGTLAVYNGDLYAAGAFSSAGGNAANRIAKWNGTSWSQVGSGANNYILALEVYNGELYAGGFFTVAGGQSASYIAKWNGTNWSPVGTGMNNYVWSLGVYNGELYAAGDFTLAGGTSANRIAKWNGSTWSAVGTGLNNTSYAFAEYLGDMYVGGQFTQAGGQSANYIAKWNSPVGIASSHSSAKVEFLPNPNAGHFRVNITNPPTTMKLHVFNVLGEIVHIQQMLETTEVDISVQPKGIYFCKVTNGDNEAISFKKIVVH